MSTNPIRRSQVLFAWGMALPFLAVFGVFVAYPFLRSLALSAHQTFGPEHEVFVGAKNYALLLEDPLFWTAVRNTAVYTLGSLLIQLPLAFLLALALSSRTLRGRTLYRLIFFSPQLMGMVFVSILATLAFEKRAGFVNQFLAFLSGNDTLLETDWLQSHVMSTLIIVSLWMYVGFNMIYFLAALQNVDETLLEASEIDGAGPIARVRHVVLPSVRPVALFVVLLSIIGSLQLFELPYVLLDSSGGPSNQGLTLVMYLFQSGFEIGDLGYASAIGWVLAITLIALAFVQLKFIAREGASR